MDQFIAHIFTSSGTFNVTSVERYARAVEYVAGGGGGGGGGLGGGGAGGAGGFRRILWWGGSAETAHLSAGPTAYTITVGAGGLGAVQDHPPSIGGDGVDSSISGPDITTVTSTKGGGGGGNGTEGAGRTGGSGGGTGNQPYTVGAGTANQGMLVVLHDLLRMPVVVAVVLVLLVVMLLVIQ